MTVAVVALYVLGGLATYAFISTSNALARARGHGIHQPVFDMVAVLLWPMAIAAMSVGVLVFWAVDEAQARRYR